MPGSVGPPLSGEFIESADYFNRRRRSQCEQVSDIANVSLSGAGRAQPQRLRGVVTLDSLLVLVATQAADEHACEKRRDIDRRILQEFGRHLADAHELLDGERDLADGRDAL